MKFLDLEGREYGRDITKYARKEKSRSLFQQKVGDILESLFPNCGIFEEVPCYGEGCFMDFFIPALRICVESDGIQHEEYTPYFHKDRSAFAQSLKRDVLKERWCEKNNIRLVRIPSRINEDGKIREYIIHEIEQ